MKQNTKKVLSILTALGMCQTFAFNVYADSEYESLSMGSMQSVFEKGAQPVYIEPIGYDADGEEVQIDDPTALTYTSSNESAVKVSADGEMSFVDYGISTVTAEYNGISTSMLVTVTPNEYYTLDYETPDATNNISTDYARSGSASLKVEGGITTYKDWDNGGAEVQAAKQESLVWGANDKKSNNVLQAWFYDNGKTENSEAGISFKRHENYDNTGAIGIINAADTTYKISGINGRWDQINYPSHMTNAADTQIKRTPGWHQVAIVQKNLSGNVVSGDDSKSTSYTVYLDGKEVKSETSSENTKYIIMGYAGATQGSYAYFDDVSRAEYMSLESVTVATDETDGELLKASPTYYGATAAAEVTASYQWYAAETKTGEYSAIDGAAEKTYKPDNAALGNKKFIKVGVTVTDGKATEEVMSDASFIFTGVYESISLNKSELSYTELGEKQLKLVGYDASGVERAISDLSGITFTSSKPEIAEVGENGILNIKDYGTTTITAEREGLKTSALVSVVSGNYIHTGWQGILHKDYNESATAIARTGQGALALAGKTSNDFPEAQTSIWMNNEIVIENVVSVAYFYDNGQTTDAEAAIDFGRYQSWSYPGTFGIINSADTTYKMITFLPNNMNNGQVQVSKATDLGIPRTQGWHQVVLVQKRLAGNTNKNSGVPDSHTVYFDGIKVKEAKNGDSDFTADQIRLYAGGDSEHIAYFDDVDTFYYTELAGATISADETDGETLVANAEYYGESGSDASMYYSWYMSDTENGEYTKIANATAKTYKPSGDAAGKFIKAGIRVIDTVNGAEVETSERLSDAVYAFDGIYSSISLGKSDSYFVKGEVSESQLKITGFGKDGLERGISDISGFTFASSNKDVAEVDANGKLTIKDYGKTTITAVCAGLKASLMVTVTPKTIKAQNNDSALTTIARRGQGAAAVNGGTVEYTNVDNPSEKRVAGNSTNTIWNWTMGSSNTVSEMWFYDNGKKENATAAVNFTSYENYSMTRALGVIDSASDYYQLANADGRHDRVQVSSLEHAENTQIVRTPGWHQVTLVQVNPKGNEFYTGQRGEFNGKAAKTTHYTLYLDGQEVMDADSTTIARFIITAQAGQFEENTAWFDDAVQNQYVGVENLRISETESGAYSADFAYYGPSGENAAVEYKWYASDTEDGEYSVIANETSKTFTPDAATAGKFIKASVKISDTVDSTAVTTNERFTDSILAGGTFMEYLPNGKLLITADRDIENAVAVIAIYEKSGDFQKLVSIKTVNSVSVSKGNSKSVTIGTISKEAQQTAKIMLWDGIKTQRAICDSVTVD